MLTNNAFNGDDKLFQRALITLKSNIKHAKVEAPLHARLITYTCRIARFKYLNSIAGERKYLPLPTNDSCISQTESFTEVSNDTAYKEYLAERYHVLAAYLEGEGSAFERLIAPLKAQDREILRLRFRDGLNHRDIALRLGIKESASQSRLQRSLQRWKRWFFEAALIRQAPDSIKGYLQKHLVEEQPFQLIAEQNCRTATEIGRLVGEYISEWRSKYH